jgi:hypothetical protein
VIVYVGNRRARHREKRALWYSWLGQWGYSALPVFYALAKLKPNSMHVAWMANEIERGFLREHRGILGYPTIRLYGPTVLARDHGLIGLVDETRCSRLDRVAGRSTTVHDLAAQFLAARLGRFAPGVPLLTHFGGQAHTHLPDGIGYFADAHPIEVYSNVLPSALEVELTQKSRDRVYRTFVLYAQVIAAQTTIRDVRFYFGDRNLRDTYAGLFNAEDWPDFEYSATRSKLVESRPYRIPLDSPVRDRFSFITEPSLWPKR